MEGTVIINQYEI